MIADSQYPIDENRRRTKPIGYRLSFIGYAAWPHRRAVRHAYLAYYDHPWLPVCVVRARLAKTLRRDL
jgi:hypothetical protein